jgi:tRNA (mo5U34)-methyltransferase
VNTKPRTLKHLDEAQKLVDSVAQWHQKFEIVPGLVTPGSYNPGFLLDKMQLPEDLSGQRVLDVGASDGFFSMSLARRGASVVAIDYRPKELHGFGVMERLTGLEFEYRQANLYDLRPAELGTFSIVIFFGVLYHLPDMLRAFAILRSLCSAQLFLETHCCRDFPGEIPVARYWRARTLNNDYTNFWSPTAQCVKDMLLDAGFEIERAEGWAERYFAAARASGDSEAAVKLRLAYGIFDMPASPDLDD